MQKKFITNLGLLLFLNLLIKPFWLLGIDRVVQNETGADVYGTYYALFNFSFLFNILLDLGITNFNNRNISQNKQLLQKHLSGIITLRLLLMFLYGGVSLLAAALLGYQGPQITMLLILLLNQALISFILYLRSNLAGLHLFKTDSIVSVLDRTIMIVICGWLLWGRPDEEAFRIEWFIWAQTVAYVCTILFVLVFLSAKVRFVPIRWSPVFALMILKKSYPFAVLILLMTFYNRIDSVMLERMLSDGAKQAGIYAQAYRLMDAANMIAYLFAALLLPIFSYQLKKQEDIKPVLKLSYALISIPAIIIAIVAAFHGTQIMDLLYDEHTTDSATIFMLLMGAFVAISTTYIFGTLLTANGNLRQLNLMAGAGMAVNIILNLFLIPKWHATGAAIASFITQVLTALIQMVLCVGIFKLPVNGKLITAYLTFFVTSILAACGIQQVFESWVMQMVLMILTFIGISLILKIIDIRELIRVVRSKSA